jgi:predicted DNA-binding transcriptional regulator YafY
MAAPQRSRLPSSRPPLARMMRIHDELQRGALTNCSRLARDLEVSPKTIMRDLAFMRDQLDLPLEYDAQIYAWRYTYPVKSFPTVKVSEGELLALLVAQKALEQYKGTPFHDQLSHAFDKLSSGLNDRISFSDSGNLQGVSFHHLGLSKADMKVFAALSRAVLQNLEVTFDYTKPNAKPERRRVRPYHLANRENAWYLVGFDLDREDLRNFAVVRMKSVTVTARKFKKPADFSPERHFAGSFGAFVGRGDYTVVVRFSADVAGRIRERVWHETLEIRDLSDGGLECTLRLNSLEEIQRWILGWGPKAKVIAPRELAASVAAAADAIRERYTADS